MRIAHLWLLVGLTAFVAGCGQKGPLVLPDTPKHKKVVPAAASTPAAAPTPAGAPAPASAATPAASAGTPDITPKP